MSLQNKNNQFLGNKNDTSHDIVDIFDQYGAGDDGNISTQPTGSITDDMQADDLVPQSEPVVQDDVISEVPPITIAADDKKPIRQERAKSWEAEYEGGHEQKVAPIMPEPADLSKTVEDVSVQTPVIAADPVQESEVGAVKAVQEPIEQQQEKAIAKEETPPAVVVASQPVAPPLKENINAVVQKEPVRDLRQSFAHKAVVAKVTKSDHAIKIDPSKKTIAIVDDDVDTLDMYANIFEMADYNVIKASDGLEALSVISEHVPHLIFTGIVMPRMDGFAMMEALRQNSRLADIPVVINSHLGREADRKRAEELGAKDFIIRGFTPPREVLERIGALLLRSEYTFHFDASDPEARKLVKDLGASNFFVCPRGQEMVLKLSIEDPKELRFSARFSCIDTKDKD